MADGIKQEYQEKLGEEFGDVLYELRSDWLTGLVRLKEYRVLFGDRDTVGLLNAVGGAFMFDMQQILWRDLLLYVTRLTDPATIAGHQNLTVQAIPPFCDELQATHPRLRAEVQVLVDHAVAAAGNPRDWRNRRISHTDLGLAINPDAESLAPTSLARVQVALDAVHAVVETIARQVVGHDTPNDVAVEPRAGAFLAYLKQLVTAVQYVDSVIDPRRGREVTDPDAAERFITSVGRHPNLDEVCKVIGLREAARRFR